MSTKYLTQEFWDEQAELHPEVMKRFRAWVDKFKVDNDWASLFNEGIIAKPTVDGWDTGTYRKAPKVHELPDAMQVGIFMSWQADEDPDPMTHDIVEGAPTYILDVLKEMEEDHES